MNGYWSVEQDLGCSISGNSECKRNNMLKYC